MDYEDEIIEEEVDEEKWPHAEPPKGLNNLRACIPCLLVKTFNQFSDEGCENCMEAVDFRQDSEKIAECTTTSFQGLMAMTVPPQSWVARWQFVQNFIPGVYALKVKGDVSEDVARELEKAQLPNVGWGGKKK